MFLYIECHVLLIRRANIIIIIINIAIGEIQLYDRVVSNNLDLDLDLMYENKRILLLKIVNQSMENINKLIEKNTWNFTRSPGDRHFLLLLLNVYFHWYGIF